jgi:hypothetical protein
MLKFLYRLKGEKIIKEGI